METAIEILVQILFIVEEILCMHGILQMKLVKGWRLMLSGTLLGIAAIFAGAKVFGTFGMPIMLLVKVLLMIPMFCERVMETVWKYFFSMFYMSMFLRPVRWFYMLVCRLCGFDWQVGWAVIIDECFQVATLVIIVLILDKKEMWKQQIYQMNLRYYVIGFFVAFSASGVWEIAHHILTRQPMPVVIFYELLCLGFTEFMYLFGIMLAYVNNLRVQYQKESQIKGNLLQIERAYEQTIKQNVKDAETIRHDMKHHLRMLHVFLERKEYAQLGQYLSQVEEHVKHIGISGGSVGNVLADAVIQDQRSEMEEDMKLICEGKLPRDLGVDDYDLCVIFANLISNAREACAKLQHHEKVIRIRIYQGEHRIKLEFSNPVEWEIDLENLESSTTKENKRVHGYGLRSVQDTVRKYGGDFEKEWKDGRIVFRILFYKPVVLSNQIPLGKQK